VAKTKILAHEQIGNKIRRMAYQIFEKHFEEQVIVLAGIADRGYTLALRIAGELKKAGMPEVRLIELKLDKQNLMTQNYQVQDNLDDKVVIVVDDVLNSGKTLLYGVKPFLSHPVKHLATLVLIDRSHRQFPVHADYVGMPMATTLAQNIQVVFNDDEDAAWLED
jgi:pyrimidine operon attenuation protein/uracil phosphoribosyltransferase